jgi:hypothetical protein
MRLFYGMIYCAALTAFAFSAENVPSFREQKKDKRQIFLKEPALALFFLHARQELEVQQTAQDVKQVIGICGILPVPLPATSTTQLHSTQRKKCYICPRSKTRKPNSSVVSAIILCAKSTTNGCATNGRSKI